MNVRAGARMRTRTRTDTRHHTRRTMGQVTLLGSPVPSASGPPERRGSTDPDPKSVIRKSGWLKLKVCRSIMQEPMAVSLLLVLQNPKAHNFLTLELGGLAAPQTPLQYCECAAPKPPAMMGACRPPGPLQLRGAAPPAPPAMIAPEHVLWSIEHDLCS